MEIEDRRILMQAMIVSAYAEIAGMQAHDAVTLANGNNNVYTEGSYQEVITRNGISHNQVIDYLGGK